MQAHISPRKQIFFLLVEFDLWGNFYPVHQILITFPRFIYHALRHVPKQQNISETLTQKNVTGTFLMRFLICISREFQDPKHWKSKCLHILLYICVVPANNHTLPPQKFFISKHPSPWNFHFLVHQQSSQFMTLWHSSWLITFITWGCQSRGKLLLLAGM